MAKKNNKNNPVKSIWILSVMISDSSCFQKIWIGLLVFPPPHHQTLRQPVRPIERGIWDLTPTSPLLRQWPTQWNLQGLHIRLKMPHLRCKANVKISASSFYPFQFGPEKIRYHLHFSVLGIHCLSPWQTMYPPFSDLEGGTNRCKSRAQILTQHCHGPDDNDCDQSCQ